MNKVRYTPVVRTAKALMDTGKRGELRSIREVGKGR